MTYQSKVAQRRQDTSAVDWAEILIENIPEIANGNFEMAKRVDLDAMIPRADFGDLNRSGSQERLNSLGLTALSDDSPIFKTVRKPDFQRETNHWSPRQVVDLVKSFLDDELVPSLILWDSTTYIFVIDGGHRLSALKAWITDDYGDGVISQRFYNGVISKEQRKVAKVTRTLMEGEIGRYSNLERLVGRTDAGDPLQITRASRMFRRVLSLQWVVGSKEVAESSFFKINSQGTALDDVETLLIKNRRKPIAIAARGIMRAGSGHKYWADFPAETQARFISLAGELYKTLFEPEIDSPLRTLDIPLGGSVSPVNALALLIEFLSIAGRPGPEPKPVSNYDDDDSGQETLAVMHRALAVIRRMTTTHSGSLGLHPAVYYYSDQGKHNRFLFLGMTELVARSVIDNNAESFRNFTKARADIENFLIEHKSLITLLLQNLHAKHRIPNITTLLRSLVRRINSGEPTSPEEMLTELGISGRVYNVKFATASKEFSQEARSATYVSRAIKSAMRCSVCEGLLDPVRSVSYDHVTRVRDGGKGMSDNCDIVHPYCNSSVKN